MLKQPVDCNRKTRSRKDTIRELTDSKKKIRLCVAAITDVTRQVFEMDLFVNILLSIPTGILGNFVYLYQIKIQSVL